ncbi:MAG: PRC-barrel domain-containing protein [Armatimonadota bacterium]
MEESSYHRAEAEKGPMVLERLSDLDEATRLLGSFKDIRGYSVINPRGDEVGRVDDLYMDPKQGKLAMASITFGGVWGFGAKRVLIPMDQLEIVDDRYIRVITTPEIVKGAPEFEEMDGADLMKYHDYWCKALDDMRKRAA